MDQHSPKHVFYVHSYLTYIVACSVVAHLRLPSKRVLLILGRGFTTPSCEFRVVALKPDQTKVAQVPTYGESFLILRRWRTIRSIDMLLEHFVADDSYVAYLPSTRNFLMQILATNRRCIAVNLIEEGLLTYTGRPLKEPNPSYRSFSGRAKARLKFFDHGNRSAFYSADLLPKETTTVFAISEAAKAALPQFRVEVLPNLVTPPIPSDYILSGASVFFMDPLVEQKITSLDIILTILQSLPPMGAAGARLWLKWHPSQMIHHDLERRLQAANIVHQVIPDDIAAESILLQSKGLHVFGFGSSLLFYAALWGHNSYSLLPTLGRIDPEALDRHRKITMPEVFYRMVQQL